MMSNEDFQYLVNPTQNDTECTEESCSTQYTCFGRNFFGKSSATVEIRNVGEYQLHMHCS